MYLGLSLALLVGCGLLGAWLLRIEGFWEQALTTVVLSLAALILLSVTVGAIPGGYRPLPLTASVGVLFLGLLAAAWRTGSLRRRRLDQSERRTVTAYLAVVALTLPIWLWMVFNGLLLPPVNWDELYYHLVAPGTWTAAGRFHFLDSSSPFVAGYPANFGLAMGWSMVMSGTDVWADLLGLPFVFAGLAVLFAYCHDHGYTAGNSFWAGLLFVTTPLVIFHAKSAYIDLPMATVFVVAVYFLYRYARDGDLRFLLLGGFAMGILVGAKYSGPYMALAGLVPVVYRHWSRRFRRLDPSWRRVLVLYGLPILGLGGLWYVHNLIAFHNPLYPMRFGFLNSTIFEGRYEADAFTFTTEMTWVTLLKAILDTETAPRLDSYYSGFGPQLLLLAIPAALLYLVRMKRLERETHWGWFLPMLLAVATLPAKYPRYVIYLSLCLLPYVAWLLDNLDRWSGRIVKLAAFSFACYSVFVAVPIFFVMPFEYDMAARDSWTASQIGPGRAYGMIRELNDLQRGPLRIVASSNLRMVYPLLSEHWQNEMLHVQGTTEEQWIAAMLAARPDLLAMDSAPVSATGSAVESTERQWLAGHPEAFRLVRESPFMQIWLILPGDARHAAFVEKVLASGVKP